MTPPSTPRLLPHATSIEVAPDGARHVKLLLAEPPTEQAMAEMRAFVGATGSVTWELSPGALDGAS